LQKQIEEERLAKEKDYSNLEETKGPKTGKSINTNDKTYEEVKVDKTILN